MDNSVKWSSMAMIGVCLVAIIAIGSVMYAVYGTAGVNWLSQPASTAIGLLPDGHGQNRAF